MAEMNLEFAATVVTHLAEQTAILAESLNQCFDTSWKIGPAEQGDWAAVSESLAVPGTVCVFQCGPVAALMLVPGSLGLPDWYLTPNDSQKSRLDTLAMEWGMNLIPPELEAERTAGFGVDNLLELVTECRPAESLAFLQLPVTDAAGTTLASLSMLWPVQQPRWEPLPKPEPATPVAVDVATAIPEAAAATSPKPRLPDPLARLRNLPVAVSVRLTERRINMAQLLAISPGALISFEKSCDDLLDLYVNNALYARGEAVKIGENFGLKINEIGVRPVRPSKILDG
ncbi:hypothetical protein GC163_02805 [bacterium]|nr:hypothetical protein [bacterium]